MNIKQLYILSFCVYLIVSIFTFMLYTALPAMIAKEGLSPQYSGLVFMSMLPFMLSFFYSGFIESFRKRKKSALKILMCGCNLALGLLYFLIAFLDLINDFYIILGIFVIMNILCSCSIVCLNGVGIEQSNRNQKITLNTIMLLASGLGGAIGIILSLIIYDKFGFRICNIFLGFSILISCLPLFRLYYVDSIKFIPQKILNTLKSKKSWKNILSLILLIFPLVLNNSMSSTLLIYLGFEVSVVGILSGILSSLALVIASPLMYSFIRFCGFYNALKITLIFEVLLFTFMALNMVLWQSHLYIIITLFLASLCFGAQFIFCYTLGMRWCEDSSQSGVDFSFLRMSENAGFIIAGIIASQIVGIFVANINDIKSLDSINLSSISLIFTHKGIDNNLSKAYFYIFILSAIFALLGLISIKGVKNEK
ncbi:MFS transporter [Helicobacter saguini]|uniref:MFS transporter n=1 Tax=Helicobacter saguini TaxID=1548018 RepID=A0A6L7D4E4_9HELI|nr:MFS transporter [Helicobacter saguini]MWV69067.1 MFS transporter [Helicobacter saguini]